MPCYDPPPPFANESRQNAEQAVRLLCELVGKELKAGRVPPRELIEWWRDHRAIDAKVAVDGHYGRNNVREKIRALGDVEMAIQLLDLMRGRDL